MKSDLDRLLQARNLDGAVVTGSTLESPIIYYLTGGVKLESVTIVLRSGRPGVLIHAAMERDDAVLTGLDCVPDTRWDTRAIAQSVGGDRLATKVQWTRQVLADLGLQGRIGFYGHGEIGRSHALLRALESGLPGSEVVVEFTDDLFTTARITKSQEEIEAMREVGQRTMEVVAAVADLLSSRPVSQGQLLAPDGEPMTIGHVKRFVRQELYRQGLEESGEHIFSMGGDAGVPHNRGNVDDVLQLGKSIIFDLFPRPQGGGYYHDVTRTWCLGYAPDEVQQAYEHVAASFEQVVAHLQVGRPTAAYQALTCEIFEAYGHPTINSDPRTLSGYVHSLAHGLGLEVHEAPSFSMLPGQTATLERGMVFTIEPGLYYPERGYGVRIEDTYYCDSDGQFHSLTPFPKDLVLPVRQ